MSLWHLREKTVITLLVSILLFSTGCATGSLPADNKEQPAAETGGEPEQNAPPETPPDSSQTEPVVFFDAVFERLVKKELGKEEIFPSDLESFTSISVASDEFLFLAGNGISEKSIIHFNEDSFEYDGKKYTGYGTLKSLADLKYFPNLQKLYLTLQPEIDYTTVPADIMKNLHTVFVYQSRLSDLSFLTQGESLTNIVLNTNDISDLTPLKDLKKIMRLIVDWNQIEDLGPLADLTSLKEISAYSNKISDLSPLSGLIALEEIGFYNNQISDLTPLKELKNLKAVELIANDIEDVEPLSGFNSFEELRLTDNPIRNIELLSHIANLEY